jgi:hypothetical protein
MAPLGGVERPGRMVRFARLIHTAGAAFLAEPVPHLPGERERYE